MNKLYVPLEIQAAYDKGTRSSDGNPGNQYWQNGAEYVIEALLEPQSGKLTGHEKVRYFNRSPDELDKIVVRLYHDLYRPENGKDFDLARGDMTDGVTLSLVAVNGNPVPDIATLERRGTNLVIPLPEGLKPGATIELEFGWSYVMPAVEPLGDGKYENGALFAGYWYPQVGVYDDIDGWDMFEWKGITGFYTDFADFDVTVEVPADYTVWATGILRNPDEVLAPKYRERFKTALTSDRIVAIITSDDLAGAEKFGNGSTARWNFTAAQVPDFAFGTSNRHLWDMGSLIVDSKNNRRVAVNAAYAPDSKHFHKAVELARSAIEFLSNDLPGVPFPWPSFTVFNGSFCVEYPMMTNVREYPQWPGITGHTIIHETTHTYFPFWMGINGRRYNFMAEGWTQMLPMDVENREIVALSPKFNAHFKNNSDFEEGSGRGIYDYPPMVCSMNVELASRHLVNYDRPGAAFLYLRDLLGDESFKKALRVFIDRWHERHPTPYDMFRIFEQVTGEDLSWFWNPWFFEFGYPDQAIREVRDDNAIVVEMVGAIPVPLKVTVTFTDGTVEEFYEPASAWRDECLGGTHFRTVEFSKTKTIESVELGDKIIPDIDRKNNRWVRSS